MIVAYERCADCHGTGEYYTGWEDVFVRCTECGGTGTIERVLTDEEEAVDDEG